MTLQRWIRGLPSAPRHDRWHSRAERMLGRHWVASLLVLAPVITICVAVVAAVALATMAAFAILTRLVPHQVTASAWQRLNGPVPG